MMDSHTMNSKHSPTPNMLDGFERWFFGGDPGPQDGAPASDLTAPAPLSVDQNDALIPAFSHRCDCGQHASLLACIRKNAQTAPRQESDAPAPLHF